MISTRSEELVIDTVVCLTLAKWETVSGRFGGYLSEGVITLAGIEHCFAYTVHEDVVDTVIGPPDYIEQVLNERLQITDEPRSPIPKKQS